MHNLSWIPFSPAKWTRVGFSEVFKMLFFYLFVIALMESRCFQNSQGISSAMGSITFLGASGFCIPELNSYSQFQRWTVKPTSCLHYVRSKIVHRHQSTRSDLGKTGVQHLLQSWLLISLFEGLLQSSYVDFFSVEAYKSAFLCVFLSKVLEDISHVQVSVQTDF